jgi:hypothetical protein
VFWNTERPELSKLGKWLTLTVAVLLTYTLYKFISLKATEQANAKAEAEVETEAAIAIISKAYQEKRMSKQLTAQVCSSRPKLINILWQLFNCNN